MDSNTQYKQTGNKVPITMDELMKAVLTRLEMYDKVVQSNDSTDSSPLYSPYEHPIIYNTRDGRTVEVPKDIQQRAIQEWKSNSASPRQYDGPPGYSPSSNGMSESREIHKLSGDDVGLAESGEYSQPPLNEHVMKRRTRQADYDDEDDENDGVDDDDDDNNNNNNNKVKVVKENNYNLLILVLLVFLVIGFILYRRGNLKF